MANLGQISPIILDKHNEIIAGHGRLRAAKELGWEKIKAIVLPVEAEQARKMRIADNLASNQNYDLDNLTEELNDLGILDNLDIYINDDRMIDNISMAIDAIGGMNRDKIVDSLDQAVEDYANETDDIMGEVDKQELRLKSVLEFDKIQPSEARRLNVFMSILKGEHGDDAKEAFMAHVEKVIADG